jgi:hypothetical protein
MWLQAVGRFRRWISVTTALLKLGARFVLFGATVELDAKRDPAALERHRRRLYSSNTARDGDDPARWPTLFFLRKNSALRRVRYGLF